MDIIATVSKKVADGERLTDADALALFEHADLVEVGRLADQANHLRNHDIVYFNVNRHINPTNICALSCKFCAYSRKPGEEGAYAYSIDDMVAKATEAVEQGATEVHMVGGLHPRWQLSHYKDMLRAIKTAHPDLHIKAFTAVELDWFARKARKTIEDVLLELRDAGLGSLPGGGAEIFHPEIREAICDTKVSAEQWLDTHRLAHGHGMRSNCTMLYGHIETYAHRVDHMRRLRELQDETHGFNAFIPLAFQPEHNDMGISGYTHGYDDLKTLAVARLYLDNFRHVKAYWVMMGQDIAQLGLQFGANDLDGTVVEEKISRMAGGRAGMAMSRTFIETLIAKAGRVACERDTLYNPRPAAGAPLRMPAAGGADPALKSAIAKSAYGEALSHDELCILAKGASLHELGRLANLTAERLRHGNEVAFTPAIVLGHAAVHAIGATVDSIGNAMRQCQERHKIVPTTVVLDLSLHATPDNVAPGAAGGLIELGPLLEFAWACRHSIAELDIVLRGLKGVWRLAQAESASVEDLLSRLVDGGVSQVISSPFEAETDLTHTEVVGLHRAIHAAGLSSAAKVELIAPRHGAGEPIWDGFIRRIGVLSGLASHDLGVVPQGPGLEAIAVEVADASFVTASEYLRAVALARLAAKGVASIVVPLAKIPTLSPLRGERGDQHPAEKIAPLCLHFGADSLGVIDCEQTNILAIRQQIRAAGYLPVVAGRIDAAAAAVQADGGPRHKPTLYGH